MYIMLNKGTVSAFNLCRTRAPRGKAVWPGTLFIPGEAPVLPGLGWSAPDHGIQSTISR